MADPLIIQLQKEFSQQLDAKANNATVAMAQQWLQVEGALQGEITALAQALADKKAAGEPVTPSSLIKQKRYTALLAQTQQEIEKFTGQAAMNITGLQQQAARQGIGNAVSLINAASGNVGLTFDKLGTEAVQNIVSIARAGKPLSLLLDAAYPITANAITDYLIYGTAAGWNPRKTADKIVREGLAQGLQHVLLVSRDQQVRAWRTASMMQMQKSEMVTGYRRTAAKNPRTCGACLSLDGQILDTDEVMALHPQCRCAAIPIVKGFKPPQIESGADWFNKQPDNIKRGILGNRKFEAYQAGKFEFNELAKVVDNPVWGPSSAVKSLKELGVR